MANLTLKGLKATLKIVDTVPYSIRVQKGIELFLNSKNE